MDDFTIAEVRTDETTIFVRSHGSGPPILLLHGFPETHLMWRSVAPLLARDFTVVCAEGPLDKWYAKQGGPLALWRNWADDVRGHALDAGHFFPEEAPEETADILRGFLATGRGM